MAVRYNDSTLDMQPGKVSKSESLNISEESGGDEEDADIPEKVVSEKCTLKELSKMCGDIDSVKEKDRKLIQI